MIRDQIAILPGAVVRLFNRTAPAYFNRTVLWGNGPTLSTVHEQAPQIGIEGMKAAASALAWVWNENPSINELQSASVRNTGNSLSN